MRTRLHLLGCIAAIALTACENEQHQIGTALPAAETLATAPSRPMPPVLMQVELVTEAIQDTIAAGKWKVAEKMATSLHQVQDQLEEVGAPPSDIARLESNVQELRAALLNQNALEANLAANRASRSVMMMTQAFASPVPAAVRLMGIDARDVLYMTQRADWSSANEATAALLDRYGEVQPHVRSNDPELDRRTEADLNALQRAVGASDGPRIEMLVERILREVALIGQLYRA